MFTYIQNALVLSWLEINLFDRTQRKSGKKQPHSLDLSFLLDFSCNSVSFSIAFMSSLANEVKKIINDYQMNMSVAFGFTAQFGKSD